MTEPNLHAKMAHFVEVTAAQLDDSNKKLAAAESARDAYAGKVPETVDSLIAMGFLKSASRAVAIQRLSDPAYALEQLVKMAGAAMNDPENEPPSLGTAVAPTQPAAQPATSTKRANSRRSAHGDEFVRKLGLNPDELEQ